MEAWLEALLRLRLPYRIPSPQDLAEVSEALNKMAIFEMAIE